MLREFLNSHYTHQGIIPISKLSIEWQNYQALDNLQWFEHDDLTAKTAALQRQLRAIKELNLNDNEHFRMKKARINLELTDFDFPADKLIEWPALNDGERELVNAASDSTSTALDVSTATLHRKVGKIESDDTDTVAAKQLKAMRKSLKQTDIFDWNPTFKSTDPRSNKFVLTYGANESIMKKYDGFTLQEKELFEAKKEKFFGAFEKDKNKPLFADGRWEGNLLLNEKKYLNVQLHHILKIYTNLDVETKPALHSDFTLLQSKCRALNMPNQATLLSVGKLLGNLGAVWELLNHSNSILDHLYGLIDPTILTAKQVETMWDLRLGDKMNRLCSTSLLTEALNIFKADTKFHNMGKKDFVKWARTFFLNFNLWGSKKPDRVRDEKSFPTTFEELPLPLQQLWTKYNKLYVEKSAAIMSRPPTFSKKHNHRASEYQNESQRNTYYRGNRYNNRGRGRYNNRGRGRYNTRGRPRGRFNNRGRGRYNRYNNRFNNRYQNNYNNRNNYDSYNTRDHNRQYDRPSTDNRTRERDYRSNNNTDTRRDNNKPTVENRRDTRRSPVSDRRGGRFQR